MDRRTRPVQLIRGHCTSGQPGQRRPIHRTPFPRGQSPLRTKRPQTRIHRLHLRRRPPRRSRRGRPPPRRRHRRLPASAPTENPSSYRRAPNPTSTRPRPQNEFAPPPANVRSLRQPDRAEPKAIFLRWLRARSFFLVASLRPISASPRLRVKITLSGFPPHSTTGSSAPSNPRYSRPTPLPQPFWYIDLTSTSKFSNARKGRCLV